MSRRKTTYSKSIQLGQRAGLWSLLSLCLLLMLSGSVAQAESGESRKIRNIKIEILPVFDGDDIGEFYEVVNDLKISTREHIVRQELFFKEGDNYDEFLIKESERALRSLAFLRQVSITPIPNNGFVDILVSVQDTWTLFPQFGFSSGGGTSKTEVGLVETNLLGYGKRLELFYADDEGRETYSALWDDRRVLGSDLRLILGHLERTDGFRNVTFIGQPFRGLVDNTAWRLETDFSDLVERLFANSDERYIYRNKHHNVSGRIVKSYGNPETLRHRFSLGYEYNLDEFQEADADDYRDVDVDPSIVPPNPDLLAEDRKFSGPFFVYDRIAQDFISINYIDRFERIEDFNLGDVLSTKIFVSPKAFGSERDYVLGTASFSTGGRLSPTSFGRGEIGASTRYNNRGFEDTVVRAEGKYYHIFGATYLGGTYIGKHTLAVNFNLDYSHKLDRDREFLLGASNGLRGYKDRTFTGDKRFLFNVEQRFHVAEDILRLLSVGGAVFVDVGGTTNKSLGRMFTDDTYGDVGVGLRLGFPRSSGSGVLRIDVAFPFRDGPDGSGRWEPRLYISTGQLFGGRTRSESVGAEKSNQTLGAAQ